VSKNRRYSGVDFRFICWIFRRIVL